MGEERGHSLAERWANGRAFLVRPDTKGPFTMEDLSGLLDEKAAANFLGLVPRTMQSWRQKGIGPAYVKISARCLRYSLSDLQAWIDTRRVGSAPADG